MQSTITFPLFGDDFVLNIPRYFEIFGFKIYFYALCIVLGFVLAAVYIIRRRDFFNLTTDNVLDMLLIAVPCGIIGARLYYMLFNFNDFFGPGQWGNILKLREGGLAVYGGIIASGLGFYIYSRKKQIPMGNLLDAAGFGLFIGQAIGRWGNFINAEAYGVETDLPWKMGVGEYNEVTGLPIYNHPTFLYESLWNLGGLLIMHVFSKRYKAKYPGQYFLFYVAWYGLGRFMIEGLRVDSLLIPGSDLRVSQMLAIVSFGIAVTLLISGNSKHAALAEGETDDDYEQDEAGETDDESDLEDIADEENVEELSTLDGATEEDIDTENDETEDDTDK